jgi:NAD(P)-dependent dehydrogenase (short-subunit alcohol dehydrogenase family)
VDVTGAVALVTGGASGLGLATTKALLEAGANVVILDLPTSAGEQVAKELGDRVRFTPADVRNEAEVTAALDVTDAFGVLRVCVNCAGTGNAFRTVGKHGAFPLAEFTRIIEINLVGTFNVLRLAAERMLAHDPIGEERGVIINTASAAAFDGQIGQAAYSASKAGVVGMTLPIARDLASLGVRVMTIAPGTFDTPMLALLPSEARQALAAGIPFPRRLGRPQEFAQLARQIVENPYLNGETIRLDGALRMPPK